MTMNTSLKYLLLTMLCLSGMSAFAQTPKQQSIDIISSYKPHLLNTTKIDLTAGNLSADTSFKPTLKYDVPAKNLFYSYAPPAISPLALEQDSLPELGNRNYIKIGAGNYSTPYAKAGFSFGDGKKTLINLYGDYISSNGNIQYQDYMLGSLKATGSFFSKNNELYVSAG